MEFIGVVNGWTGHGQGGSNQKWDVNVGCTMGWASCGITRLLVCLTWVFLWAWCCEDGVVGTVIAAVSHQSLMIARISSMSESVAESQGTILWRSWVIRTCCCKNLGLCATKALSCFGGKMTWVDRKIANPCWQCFSFLQRTSFSQSFSCSSFGTLMAVQEAMKLEAAEISVHVLVDEPRWDSGGVRP